MQLLYSFAHLTSPPSFINLWWSSRIVSREREEHGPFCVEAFVAHQGYYDIINMAVSLHV